LGLARDGRWTILRSVNRFFFLKKLIHLSNLPRSSLFCSRWI
jgi:hypothetical protein